MNFYNQDFIWIKQSFFLLYVSWWPGFAGEDWLHTWCDNRPEKVWWSPTRVCPLRGTANHRYRGKTKKVVTFLCSTVVGQVHSIFMWCPNDESFIFCSNHSYSDSLPLRADWIPFLPKCHSSIVFTLHVKENSKELPSCTIFPFPLNLADICWQNPQRPFWGWAGSAVWESWPHLGLAPDDGSSQWPEQRLRLCNFLH